MSAIKITLEINSVKQANALVAALENYIDCNEDRVLEETKYFEKQRAKGEMPDIDAVSEVDEIRSHMSSVRVLLKSIGAE